MGRTLNIGSLSGIRVQLHWTFLLLIAWVLVASLAGGAGAAGAAARVGFVLLLFGCVVLHEFGHAFAARRYGIPTRDITLLPIGGVARLERMPKDPKQEIVVALAGPAVNVLIAGGLAVVLAARGEFADVAALTSGEATLPMQLFAVNIMLVAFNLLPAFPLDGGRVLRAVLGLFTDYTRATRIAAGVGQVCALGLGLLGMFNPMLLLIAAFIFFGAASEARQVSVQEQFSGYRVSAGTFREFRAVSTQARVSEIADSLLSSPQRDFPVIDRGVFVGMLRRRDLRTHLESGPNVLVEQAMESDPPMIRESDDLMTALSAAGQDGDCDLLAVVRDGELTGLLDPRDVAELIQTRQQLARTTSRVGDQPSSTSRPATPSGGRLSSAFPPLSVRTD